MKSFRKETSKFLAISSKTRICTPFRTSFSRSEMKRKTRYISLFSEFNQNVSFADFREKKRCARTGHGAQLGEEKQSCPAVPGDRCQRVCLQNSVSTSTLLENIESSASEIHYAKREKVQLYTFHLFKDAPFLFLFSLSFSSYAHFCTLAQEVRKTCLFPFDNTVLKDANKSIPILAH